MRDDHVLCTSPLSPEPGTTMVEVSSNAGVDFTRQGKQFTYRVAPAIGSVSPRAGPMGGGTHVIVSGTDFFTTATIMCCFGEACTSGTLPGGKK